MLWCINSSPQSFPLFYQPEAERSQNTIIDRIEDSNKERHWKWGFTKKNPYPVHAPKLKKAGEKHYEYLSQRVPSNQSFLECTHGEPDECLD